MTGDDLKRYFDLRSALQHWRRWGCPGQRRSLALMGDLEFLMRLIEESEIMMTTQLNSEGKK